MEIVVILLAFIVLLLLKGFFSGSEIALVNADKLKLETKAAQGNEGASLAMKQLQHHDRLLATTLIGTNISTVALSVLGTTLAIGLLGDGGDLLALAILMPLLLIFGEIVPKSVFQQAANRITPVIAYPLQLFFWIFSPAVLLFAAVSRFIARRIVGGEAPRTLFVVREQLRTLIDASERAASVAVFDRVRIKNVIRFPDITVGEVMTPMSEVAAISDKANIDDLIAEVRHLGVSRLPVFSGNIGKVTGVVMLTPWQQMDPETRQKTLSDLVHKPHFVTLREPLEALLPVLSQRADSLAIVLDEFGTAIGVVSVRDIAEIVIRRVGGKDSNGKMPGQPAMSYQALDEDTYLVDARLRISQVNELLETDIETGEFHTVGGLLSARLRRVPAKGDSVTEGVYRFTVDEATEHGAAKVLIERIVAKAS